jgi:hypothetical protein
MAALGLMLVGVSILVPSPNECDFEYCATFSFIIALAVLAPVSGGRIEDS